jgi:hypothetical protein
MARSLSLGVSTAISLLLLVILVYILLSPIPFFWMRHELIGNGILSVTVIDELLQIEYITSYPNRAELLDDLRDRKRESQYYYEDFDVLRKTRNKDGDDERRDNLIKSDYRVLKQEGPPFYFSFHRPWSVSKSIRVNGTFKTMSSFIVKRTYILCPLWALVIVLPIQPTIAFVRGPYRRYRRRKKGLCLTCGYNLTGNVSGVCPECGEQI